MQMQQRSLRPRHPLGRDKLKFSGASPAMSPCIGGCIAYSTAPTAVEYACGIGMMNMDYADRRRSRGNGESRYVGIKMA
ncbi:hypothetical protein JTE90_023160 [Oedothorax gibbosus]|uniref:Uncharacterized protein n=1 Tax=Oedothorax gibbosus TaxID=931172 RepID=A0AAV6URQ1_9ARAC|nr:hypothetical protein JTE90_023160 [Oedothorax gibbosus]